MKEVVEVMFLYLQESIRQRTAKEIVVQIHVRTVHVGKVIPQERVFRAGNFPHRSSKCSSNSLHKTASLTGQVSTLFGREWNRKWIFLFIGVWKRSGKPKSSTLPCRSSLVSTHLRSLQRAVEQSRDALVSNVSHT